MLSPAKASVRKGAHYMYAWQVILLLIWNIFVWFIYVADKGKAIKGQWRISEKTLLLLALCFGAIGAWAAMTGAHHKTKKPKFAIVPLLAIAQGAFYFYIML